MGTKIAVAVMIVVYVLFFLSVVAPMHSRKRFWIVIRKIRESMDFAVYWFFNLCGIAAILVMIYIFVKEFAEKINL